MFWIGSHGDKRKNCQIPVPSWIQFSGSHHSFWDCPFIKDQSWRRLPGCCLWGERYPNSSVWANLLFKDLRDAGWFYMGNKGIEYVLPNVNLIRLRGGLAERIELARPFNCKYVEIPADFIKNGTEERITGGEIGTPLKKKTYSSPVYTEPDRKRRL